ncbi:hypothetical protein Fmac_011730 [Flemingia macrophylla]|uniref:Uncharacterized protein n=1 Tax=Flemingia macrophylla TaxID=520843 RepID=A0ABD1MNA5_9FABA
MAALPLPLPSLLSLQPNFKDPGPHDNGRYSDHMLPEVEVKDFRKGAQCAKGSSIAIAEKHNLKNLAVKRILQEEHGNVIEVALIKDRKTGQHQAKVVTVEDMIDGR